MSKGVMSPERFQYKDTLRRIRAVEKAIDRLMARLQRHHGKLDQVKEEMLALTDAVHSGKEQIKAFAEDWGRDEDAA